ncbi:PPOX class F420-dependent enzyme [Pseudofrankia asymbiotica]|uniref:PPOX class F420-dependent enzyme n=2 Tax=Pseudofrankia asymbiotica TaxID=1834516 RepID=A0A1V2IAV9_9ACTN|nr:PPOX class F420-dependent enzyme [Pseudofrankia asymbiotica]
MKETEQAVYEPGRGPGPTVLEQDRLAALLAAHQMGALATTRQDGRPHLSTVAYGWDEAARTIRISTTIDRLKVRHLRRDPRAALYVSTADFLSFVVAEGEAELSEVSATPGDAVGRELLAMAPPFDDPADERAFLRNMAADRRLVIRLGVRRLYGTALDIP